MTISETTQTSVEDYSPDPAVMRRVVSHFCTGVAVVTALRAHPQRDPLLFFRGGFGGFAGRVEAAGSGDA
ncbi:hypothetical protein [Mycobacterium sp. NPDC050041]|uniref:hypothetical protein n=1 Tax=Mycobacterium sp. NPDC050041 TaxID=3364293 RepID=UPI003C2E0B51